VALTIIYVAVENLRLKKPEHRWRLTFCFGLIHGFSFANTLNNLGLPTQGLIRSLLAFNVGVELGQICIVLALLPLTLWLAKQSYGRRVQMGISILIGITGACWFVDRAFALKFMPF